jgi:hypothetical protein
MVEIIQGSSTPFHHQQESSGKDDLTLKVFIKVFTKEKLSVSDLDKISRCLDYFIDEPCIFLSKTNDRHSAETLSLLRVKHRALSLKDLSTQSTRSTVVIFIIKNINKNIRKIIEIICKDLFSYSIIFV